MAAQACNSNRVGGCQCRLQCFIHPRRAIGSEPPRLFHIYPEGNFIEATDDTPYFQIGEHSTGR